jgi:hypothetical protein
MGFGVPAPVYWDGLSWLDRRRSSLGDETCIIKAQHFFVRGLLEVPVKGRKTPFVWNVWSSVSRDSFGTMLEHWTSEDRAKDEPFDGWLSNDLSAVYPSTLNLKLLVHTRKLGMRPRLELEAAEHPLAAEQHEGITPDRVREINSALRHYKGLAR